MTTRRVNPKKPSSERPKRESGRVQRSSSPSGLQVRAVPELVEAYKREQDPPRGRNSITDEEMRSVQKFLRTWVAKNCPTRPDGRPWSQREIADALGITQNEYSSWMNDRARPGLPRLIQLRKATGVPVDKILGLS